jgi:hypothetical protein
MPQQQIQKQTRKAPRDTRVQTDAPTVNSKIAKLWFGGQS